MAHLHIIEIAVTSLLKWKHKRSMEAMRQPRHGIQVVSERVSGESQPYIPSHLTDIGFERSYSLFFEGSWRAHDVLVPSV
jgi:hypothetical protein